MNEWQLLQHIHRNFVSPKIRLYNELKLQLTQQNNFVCYDTRDKLTYVKFGAEIHLSWDVPQTAGDYLVIRVVASPPEAYDHFNLDSCARPGHTHPEGRKHVFKIKSHAGNKVSYHVVDGHAYAIIQIRTSRQLCILFNCLPRDQDHLPPAAKRDWMVQIRGTLRNTALWGDHLVRIQSTMPVRLRVRSTKSPNSALDFQTPQLKEIRKLLKDIGPGKERLALVIARLKEIRDLPGQTISWQYYAIRLTEEQGTVALAEAVTRPVSQDVLVNQAIDEMIAPILASSMVSSSLQTSIDEERQSSIDAREVTEAVMQIE